MGGIYGHRWTSSYGANPADPLSAGEMWARGLVAYSPQQIARAVRGCMLGTATADGWPPTLPQFRELCLALPTIAEVRRELLSRDGQRTSFGLLVGQRLDLYRWRQSEERDAERMLREAYAEARTHALSGGDMPAVSVAIAHEVAAEPEREASPEVAARVMAQMRALFDD